MSYLDYGLDTGSYYGNGGVTSGTSGVYSATATKRQASVASLSNLSNINATSYASKYNQINIYLQEGETEKALELWNDLKEEVTTAYASTNNNWYMDDSSIETQLENGFYATTGLNFDDGLESEFVHQFKKSIPIVNLFTDDYSKEEYLAKKTGTEMSDKTKTKGVFGRICGTLVTAAGGGAAAGVTAAVIAGGLTTPVGWIALAGAAVGGAISYLCNN